MQWINNVLTVMSTGYNIKLTVMHLFTGLYRWLTIKKWQSLQSLQLNQVAQIHTTFNSSAALPGRKTTSINKSITHN